MRSNDVRPVSSMRWMYGTHRAQPRPHPKRAVSPSRSQPLWSAYALSSRKLTSKHTQRSTRVMARGRVYGRNAEDVITFLPKSMWMLSAVVLMALWKMMPGPLICCLTRTQASELLLVENTPTRAGLT